jgi:mRNA interferase MazF
LVAALRSYVPEAGDVVWLDFNPQVGHEQAGRRPALVLSPRAYNEKSGLAIFCPITSVVKNYPFEIALPAGLRVRGAVLADQLKSVDWRERRVQKFDRLAGTTVEMVRQYIAALLGIK